VRLLLLSLIFFGTTVQAHEELDYRTHYLFMWTGNCTNRLIPTFQQRGVPWTYSFSLASQNCSCVIDKFREQYTQTEVMSLSDQEREERSLYFAKVCAGKIKEM
jgi:hypothetical protein